VEFGAKLSVSLTGDGVACVDHLRWDAFHEGGDLKSQVEAYRTRHGHAAPRPEKPSVPVVATQTDTHAVQDMEAQYIARLLKRHQGNRRLVAAALGVSERTMYRRLKHYGLT
jgi:transcriptional regulator with PAS, ATPase and Fis domain